MAKERGPKPLVNGLNKLSFSELAHLAQMVLDAGRAYKKRLKFALWDVVVICEHYDIPKPMWARKALIAHGLAQWNKSDADHKTGRHARPLQAHRQRFIDKLCYLEVQDLRTIDASEKEAIFEVASFNGISEAGVRKMVARHKAKLKSKNNLYDSPLFGDPPSSK